MRSLSLFKNTTKKGMVVIMSAMLVMTPVCAPIGIYAGTIADNPAGVTLAEIPDGETMDNNYGIVTVNNGAITNNEGEVATNGYTGVITNNDGTVSTNYYEVQNNFGTINENFCRVINNVGEVTNNYSNVEDNWGTVTSMTYPDSVGSAVLTNHASGTVTGECELVNNYGTVTGNQVQVDNDYPSSEDPNPNAPAKPNNNVVVNEDIPVIAYPGEISIVNGTDAVNTVNNSTTDPEISVNIFNRISGYMTECPDSNCINLDMRGQTGFTVSDVRAMFEIRPDVAKLFKSGQNHFLYIPSITDFEEYQRCLEVLRAEKGGVAGFDRLAEIFNTLGVISYIDGPSTSTVMSTPVTAPEEVHALKGYTLTAEEQALVSVTEEQSVALAQGITVETSNAVMTESKPEMIAMAKVDILKDNSVKKSIDKYGVTGEIVKSGSIAMADGSTARKKVTLNVDNLTSKQNVAILYYIPGDLTPHIVKATWKNGKLVATLPVPCAYHIVV